MSVSYCPVVSKLMTFNSGPSFSVLNLFEFTKFTGIASLLSWEVQCTAVMAGNGTF